VVQQEHVAPAGQNFVAVVAMSEQTMQPVAFAEKVVQPVFETDLLLAADEKSAGIAVVPAAQAQLETRQVEQKLLLVRQSLPVQWNHPHQKESEVRHYAMDVFVR
jgi:hypothetical protein